MKEIDLTREDYLVLEGFLYKKNYFILLAQAVDKEIEDYLNSLSVKYNAKVLSYDLERRKLIVVDEDDKAVKEGTNGGE